MASIDVDPLCLQSVPCRHRVTTTTAAGVHESGVWDIVRIYQWCRQHGVEPPPHVASEYAAAAAGTGGCGSTMATQACAAAPPPPPSNQFAGTFMLDTSSGRRGAATTTTTTTTTTGTIGGSRHVASLYAGAAGSMYAPMATPPDSGGRRQERDVCASTLMMLSPDSGRSARTGMTRMLSPYSGRQQWVPSVSDHPHEGSLHPGVRCDVCSKMIATGARYKCLDCPDFDLCEYCERSHGAQHGGGTHTFAKIHDSRRIDANAYVRT